MGGRFKSDRIIQLCTHNWSKGTLLGSCGFGRTNQNESILSTPDYLMETLLYEDFNATRNNGKAWNSFPQEILVNFISLRFKTLICGILKPKRLLKNVDLVFCQERIDSGFRISRYFHYPPLPDLYATEQERIKDFLRRRGVTKFWRLFMQTKSL